MNSVDKDNLPSLEGFFYKPLHWLVSPTSNASKMSIVLIAQNWQGIALESIAQKMNTMLQRLYTWRSPWWGKLVFTKLFPLIPPPDVRRVIWKIARPKYDLRIQTEQEYLCQFAGKHSGIPTILPIRHKGLAFLQFWSLCYRGKLAYQQEQVEFLVLEYLPGGSLAEFVQGYVEEDLKQRIRVALYVVYHIAQTLRFIHSRQCVHRDIKPENILFRVSPYPFSFHKLLPVLIDFGVAAAPNSLMGVAGSESWMVPELINAKGKITVNPSWDTYALGLVFCYILTRCQPPKGFLHEERADYMKNVYALVSKSEEQDPAFAPVSQGTQHFIKQALHSIPNERLKAQEFAQKTADLLKLAGVPETTMKYNQKSFGLWKNVITSLLILISTGLAFLLALGILGSFPNRGQASPSAAVMMILSPTPTSVFNAELAPPLAPVSTISQLLPPPSSTITAKSQISPATSVAADVISPTQVISQLLPPPLSTIIATNQISPAISAAADIISLTGGSILSVTLNVISPTNPITDLNPPILSPRPPAPKPAPSWPKIILDSPAENDSTGSGAYTAGFPFEWHSTPGLAAGQCYELVFWSPDKQQDKYSPMPLLKDNKVSVDFAVLPAQYFSFVTEHRTFLWGVRVVGCRQNNGKWVTTGTQGKVEQERKFTYHK